MSLPDKIVEYFSPAEGLKRRRARAALAMVGTYTGASTGLRSMFGFNPISESPDDALKFDRQKLIDRSHSLSRNNSIVAGLINANCTKIVGSGLRMYSRIDSHKLGLSDDQAELLEDNIEREWRLWSESVECDLARTNHFSGLQEIALRQSFMAGEAFGILAHLQRGPMPYGLKVQMVESERVCNKDNGSNGKQHDGTYRYDGIVKDKYGAPQTYQVASDFPGLSKAGLTWTEVPAFGEKTGLKNVLHMFKQLRPGQTRGVPYLSPVIEPLYNLGKYSKAELDAAVTAALFTVFIESETGDADISISKTSAETGSSASDDDIKLGSGAVIGLAKGEHISTANPGRPNQNFDPYFMSMVRQIGIALEIPYEQLIKHYTSSYSAARAAALDAWQFYKTRRAWLIQQFCQPVFEAFMYEAVALGRIYAPGFFDDISIRKAYCSAEWVGPSQGHIDPVKEVKAAELRMLNGITTLSQETAEYNGGQAEANIRQIKKERQWKIEAGIIAPAVDVEKELEDNDEPA
jgi:lambda family phage portal protein